MRKMIRSMKNSAQKLCIRMSLALHNNRGEGFLDTGVKILISVVIGSLLLAGLYTLFGDTVLPTLKDKIEGLFDYAG